MTMKNSALANQKHLIEHEVVNTISHTLHIPSRRLLPYTHFVDDLHLDEMDFVLLIARLESQLDRYLTSEQVAGIQTISDVTRCFSDN
ncbi:MAG: acyl carrier protein [Saprospiraceae bacterium]